MQFSKVAIATLFGSLAMAVPTPATTATTDPSEPISITDFTVRRFDTGPEAIEFHLTSTTTNTTDLLCTSSDFDFPSAVIGCGDSKYRFALIAGQASDYAVRIYHELGNSYGFWGTSDVPTYCRAGGSSPDDYVCQQVADVAFSIDQDGTE